MNIKPIRNDEDLKLTFARIEQLWGVALGSPEGDELEMLASLVQKYEDEHFPIPLSDPLDAINVDRSQAPSHSKCGTGRH